MPAIPKQLVLSALALSCAAACSKSTSIDDGGTGGGTTTGGTSGGVVDAGFYTLRVLAPVAAGSCDVHAEQPSTFTDTTAQWGLEGVSMGGIYAADLNGDGYPDLIVLSGNGDQREPIPTFSDGAFHNLGDGGFLWDVGVLMNRPNGSGGRTFVDETAQSHLFEVRGGSATEYRMAQLVAIADVNNDGYPDVFSGVAVDGNNTDHDAGFNDDTSEILLNDGQGHFTLTPRSDPSTMMEPTNNQAIFTDVDNDGILDLFLTYWYRPDRLEGSQAQLFRGRGDGTFHSITADEPGLLTPADLPNSIVNILAGKDPRPAFGTMACDLNGDGFPELLISAYGGESNVLYVNNGNGGYHRLVQPGGFDGDTDVNYHDNQYYLCYCSVHPTPQAGGYCYGAAAPAVGCPSPADAYWSPGYSDSPAEANGNNFSAACRDMDGDGKPDIFQGTIRHWWAGESTDPPTLMMNQTPAGGTISMQRVPGRTDGVVFPHIDPQGWNEGIQQVSLVDMDNDGRPDILLGGSDYSYQYGLLFIQQPDGTYQNMAKAWGLDFPCMDGLTVADFDRDGDLDVIVRASLFRNCSKGKGPNYGWPALHYPDGGLEDPGFSGYSTNEIHIFTNNAGEHSQWLEIRLVGDGTTTNRMGIGASVTVTANGVSQVQQLQGQHGIGSESDDVGVLFYGLGNCPGVDRIEVRWPNLTQTDDVWTNVPSKHLIELHQGDKNVYEVNL